jgi:hypothetical protein
MAEIVVWNGGFSGSGLTQQLTYITPGFPFSQYWYDWNLISFSITSSGNYASSVVAANTSGFGDTSSDPTWIGNFTGTGKDEVLFYDGSNQSWWLGTFSGNTLSFVLAADTTGFGNTASDPTWTGNFTGTGKGEVLFFSPGDNNWWLGTFSGNELSWFLTNNSAGIGYTRSWPTWIGDFTGGGQAQVLAGVGGLPPNQNGWQLGRFSNNFLEWTQIS